MLYVRGQPEDYDEWARLGCDGWDFASVLPYFKRAEDNENGANVYHGAGGPLAVSNIRSPHPLSEAFLQACANAGLTRKADINTPPQDGIGYLQATQRRGWRFSASRAYLWPAMRRPNVQVLLHAHTLRVLFEGKRAIGVEYSRGGRAERADAAQAVIVCAGALASPQILLLSGVGPAEHLREMGVPVVHDLPGVGQNFHDHPGTNHTALVNCTTYNVQKGLLNYFAYGAQWLLTGTGPGSTPDAHVIGFMRSRPDLDRCDVQYHFTPAGYDLVEDGPILFDKPAATGLTNVQRPWSRGWICLKTADPFDQPAIQPNLFGDERDIELLLAGAKFLRKVFETEPMSRYVVAEHMPGHDVQTDDEWRAYIRSSAMGIYHPAGTCKMGHDPMAVVDDRLKVRDLEGLYVADASIMPLIVSGNLNATCVMIGEKAADLILGR
jgi:choline dehydrogenase